MGALSDIARAALDDAASRGFPNNDRALLEIQWRTAVLLDEAADKPLTKTYADGSSATGPGPLPGHSPAEQELSDGAKRVLDSFDEAPYANFGNH